MNEVCRNERHMTCVNPGCLCPCHDSKDLVHGHRQDETCGACLDG